MVNENLSLVLLYEPATAEGRPVPIARTGDARLISAVAERALRDATERAGVLSRADETLGKLKCAEVGRLRATLAILIPGLLLSR
jgi:hypothetical protein